MDFPLRARSGLRRGWLPWPFSMNVSRPDRALGLWRPGCGRRQEPPDESPEIESTVDPVSRRREHLMPTLSRASVSVARRG